MYYSSVLLYGTLHAKKTKTATTDTLNQRPRIKYKREGKGRDRPDLHLNRSCQPHGDLLHLVNGILTLGLIAYVVPS